MRMQAKLTLVLVFIGLFSCAMVGASAYFLVLKDFRQSLAKRSVSAFTNDFVAYVAQYGSVEAAMQTEPFHTFVMRSHAMMPPDEGVVDSLEYVDRWKNPPFIHIVADADGKVLLGAGKYPDGSQLPADVLEECNPIEVYGEVVAHVVPMGIPKLLPQDFRYLSAVKTALWQGASMAIACSILLGLVFGRSLSRAVRQLTQAVQRLGEDAEGEHQVAVKSRDELGQLAQSFNRMSSELALAHKKLRELSIKDPLTNSITAATSKHRRNMPMNKPCVIHIPCRS